MTSYATVPMPLLPAPEQRIAWPAPHHMRIIDSRAAGDSERALLTMLDGEKLPGVLLGIDFEAESLDFAPERKGRRHFAFAELRSLYLTRSVELEQIPLSVPPGGVAAKPSRLRRACAVFLKDGNVLEADVLAVLARRAGLFLYVMHYGNDVLRWFVPAQAMRGYRVGDGEVQVVGEPSLAVPAGGLPPLLEQQAANLGDYFSKAGGENRQELEEALRHQKAFSRRQLADLLVEDKLITPQQRDQALAAQDGGSHRYVGDILVEMGALSRSALRQVLVGQLGVPCVNLARYQYDPNAIKALSPELARKYMVMPLYRSDRRIAVAIEDPLSWKALRELEFFTGLKVDPILATREDLEAAVAQFYGDAGGQEKIAALVARLGEESRSMEAQAAAAPVHESDNTLVRLVNKMILDAYEQGASDIHIESRADNQPSRVRFRIEGALRPYIDVPPNFRAALVSRLKIMSELDISEHRRPQDGKIHFEAFGGRPVELRVLVMPTASGLEDVVMRILAAPRALLPDQLGLAPRDLERVRQFVQRSYGLVFVCGPTGSGKTTTLHSLLSHINTPDRKIWTVEDPVEISQEGLCQVQVNPKLGLTFPSVLRSFLRADPDVIMVGETRDADTARTVISASLTGHLVLSTMHTNSAAESVVRLLDFGLDAFNCADALIGVVGQRLVRRLCGCKQAYRASDDELAALAHEHGAGTHAASPDALVARWRSRYGGEDGSVTLYAPAGCPLCDQSGYRGRLGVYEVLVATPAIKALVQSRATSDAILACAIRDGMSTLEQDGIDKILQGHLDLKQVQMACR